MRWKLGFPQYKWELGKRENKFLAHWLQVVNVRVSWPLNEIKYWCVLEKPEPVPSKMQHLKIFSYQIYVENWGEKYQCTDLVLGVEDNSTLGSWVSTRRLQNSVLGGIQPLFPSPSQVFVLPRTGRNSLIFCLNKHFCSRLCYLLIFLLFIFGLKQF